MIKNYLKIAFRTLKRHKSYTFINVAGLAVGMAVCLLIGCYVRHELSYDRFHEKAERIYRLAQKQGYDTAQRFAITPAPAAPALERELPGVEEAIRLASNDVIISLGDEAFFDQQILAADADFFDVFSFPLLKGNPETALEAPFSIVLTESAVHRYFGKENPIGKALTTRWLYGESTSTTYTVTGVMQDVPSNSHIQFDAVRSFATIAAKEPSRLDNWGTVSFWTYVLLEDDTDPGTFEAKLDAFARRHHDAGDASHVSYFLQPLISIHLYSDLQWEMSPGGNASTIYVLTVIAGFILLLACINFTNLSTARASERATEVGVRKTLGAKRRGLIAQFLGESILLAGIAALLAILLARLALPLFRMLTGTSIAGNQLFAEPTLLMLICATLVVGLLAGCYPAFVLSDFRPVRVLKSTVTGARGGMYFRKVLVVFQFTITIALLAATGVAFQQLEYVQTKDLGFNEEHVISIPLPGSEMAQVRQLQTEWSRLSGVAAITADSRRYGGSGLLTQLSRAGNASQEEVPAHFFYVDPDYIEAMDMEIVAGRDFSRDRAGDQEAFILNQAAVQALGWSSPEEAIGEELAPGSSIIGVVENFHYASLHKRIDPLALRWSPSSLRPVLLRILVRVRSASAGETLAAMEEIWNRLVPNYPFRYSFLDDMLAKQYQQDQRMSWTFGTFAGLAILIACLGLFGLAAYTAERRTKEIGIRKTFGASAPSIVGLLSKDFLKLVGVAFVIAAPVAYWAMSRWLQDFAYRIDLGPWVFIEAGVAALVVALATVSYHAIRAARANPVDALRYE